MKTNEETSGSSCYITFNDIHREVDCIVTERSNHIANRWCETLTKEYVRDKIFEAETNDRQSVILIEQDAEPRVDYNHILNDPIGERTASIASMVNCYFIEQERARYTLTVSKEMMGQRVRVTLKWYDPDKELQFEQDSLKFMCRCCIFCVCPFLTLIICCK